MVLLTNNILCLMVLLQIAVSAKPEVVSASFPFSVQDNGTVSIPSTISNEITGGRVDLLVEPLIARMREDFAQNPMVRAVASPEKEGKTTFLPLMTFFVNSFSDLNRMVLPYHDGSDENDPLKRAINQHCKEDSTHLYLLWEDLIHLEQEIREAGVNTFLDAVRFLWSDKLYKVRELSYQVAKLAGMSSKPVHRYSMIRVMEEVGNVFFTSAVGQVLKSGVSSQYLGHDHLDLESGHLQSHEGENENGEDTPSLEDLFATLSFESASDRKLAEDIMINTYDLFYDMLECVYDNMWQYTADGETN